MIPKIIHYVWVGGKPKSELIRKCIDSWKKYCPDYEIKEWNDEAIASIDNRYMWEALEAKKYAFASDFIRLYALKTDGGFYFDTDLEITQPIEGMCQYEFVSGYENWYGHMAPITAFMGASKDSVIIADLLAEYDDLPFVVDGQLDMMTNTMRITRYFSQKYGLSEPYNGHNTTQLGDDGILFPSYVFCTPEEGKENYAIHHFNASWKVRENWERKKLFSIWRYRLALFKHMFDQDEEVYPMSENERWVKKWNISKSTFVGLLKKEKR